MNPIGNPEAVRDYFNKEAPSWGQRYLATGSMRWRLGQFVPALAAIVPSGTRILDFGCGSGDLAAACAAEGFEVTAVDTSPEMIAAANRRFPETRAKFELWPVQAGTKLTYPDGYFGAFVSSSVIEYVRDPASCLAELRRICSQSAKGLITVPNIWHPVRVVEALERRMGRFAARSDFYPKGRRAYLELSQNRLGARTWKKICEGAGWECISVANRSRPLLFLTLKAVVRIPTKL